MAKEGRPEAKNAFYFPHYTRSIKVLDLIVHRYGSDGYMAYYKLLELLADADYHRLSVSTPDEKEMFDMGMGVEPKVYDDVIKILVNSNKIDKDLWEKDKVIWMDDFVKSLKPLYCNRKKPLPQKDDNNSVSTCRKGKKRKEKKNKGKKNKENKSRENMESLLSLSQLEKDYPKIDVQKSLSKFMDFTNNPNQDDATRWLDNEKIEKPVEYTKTSTGYLRAYCSECGAKHTPKDKWQVREGSQCCRADFQPTKP